MDDATAKEMLRLLRGILATVNDSRLAINGMWQEVSRASNPFMVGELATSESVRKEAQHREKWLKGLVDSLVAPDLSKPDKKTLG